MTHDARGNISASLEDYLEAIYHLEAANRVARAKDIADRLEVSRASVTGALKTLAERGLINYEPYSFITMTDQGRSIAREVIRRHDTLLEFFNNILNMDKEHAERVACRVEHAMDRVSVDSLVSFLDSLERCPRTDSTWRKAMAEICNGGHDHSKCAQCLARLKPGD